MIPTRTFLGKEQEQEQEQESGDGNMLRVEGMLGKYHYLGATWVWEKGGSQKGLCILNETRRIERCLRSFRVALMQPRVHIAFIGKR